MLEFDAQRCLGEVRQAETADLLDRVTAYRNGMEPEAVELMEQELRRRGVDAAAIAAHAEQCRRECVFDASGTALVQPLPASGGRARAAVAPAVGNVTVVSALAAALRGAPGAVARLRVSGSAVQPANPQAGGRRGEMARSSARPLRNRESRTPPA